MFGYGKIPMLGRISANMTPVMADRVSRGGQEGHISVDAGPTYSVGQRGQVLTER